MEKEYFYNEKYFVLKTLFENEVCIKSERYINISQTEISKITNIGLNKVNFILKDLKNAGYIINSDYKPQKLSITKTGYEILKKLK